MGERLTLLTERQRARLKSEIKADLRFQSGLGKRDVHRGGFREEARFLSPFLARVGTREQQVPAEIQPSCREET